MVLNVHSEKRGKGLTIYLVIALSRYNIHFSGAVVVELFVSIPGVAVNISESG